MIYQHLQLQDCNVCSGTGVINLIDESQCYACKGKGKVTFRFVDAKTVHANVEQFLSKKSEDVKAGPGPKPTSREILTEVLDQALKASREMVWFNFEEAGANERSKGIARQLNQLCGTLGDYVHALREEGK